MTCPTLDYSFPGPLVPDLAYGTLTINGILLQTSWCNVLSLATFWDDPDVRGDNTLLPLNRGVDPEPKREGETAHSLPFVVSGSVDLAGAFVANPFAQLAVNRRHLWTNVTRAVDTGTGTRSATLTFPDGTSITRAIQVVGMQGDLVGAGFWVGTLELVDPTGEFHIGYAA